VAVSKPRPKRKPTVYISRLFVTLFRNGFEDRDKNPRSQSRPSTSPGRPFAPPFPTKGPPEALENEQVGQADSHQKEGRNGRAQEAPDVSKAFQPVVGKADGGG